MYHPGNDTVFLGPWRGKEEQTAFVHAPLMTGTMVSYNSGIPASKGNPFSSDQVGGTGNILSALAG